MRRATPEGVKISHVGLAVRSIAEALPFYREILGLKDESLAGNDGARIAGFQAVFFPQAASTSASHAHRSLPVAQSIANKRARRCDCLLTAGTLTYSRPISSACPS